MLLILNSTNLYIPAVNLHFNNKLTSDITQEKVISTSDYLYSLESTEIFSEKNKTKIPEYRFVNNEYNALEVIFTQVFSTQLNLFSSILKLHTSKLHSSKFLIFGLNKILN